MKATTLPPLQRRAAQAQPRNPPQIADAQRYAWFRLHIKLAPNHGPLALLIELPVSSNASFSLDSTGPSPDIYANGRHIQPEGPHGNAPQHYQLISRIYDLNVPANETSLTLAVRIYYIAFGYGAYTTFFANRTLYLGNPGDLARELNLWSNRSLFERLPRLIYSVLLAILAALPVRALSHAERPYGISLAGPA